MLQDYEVLINGELVKLSRTSKPKVGDWVYGVVRNYRDDLVHVVGFVGELL